MLKDFSAVDENLYLRMVQEKVPMANKWTFEWITDWETIWSDDFTKKWRTWLEQSWSSHVFFHPALVKAWVETYIPLWNISPFFLIARHGDMTVFLPLVLWKRNWKNAFLREIIPVGYSNFDYHDPIIVGPTDAFKPDFFWSSLFKQLDRIDVRFDTINITGIRSQYAGSGQEWEKDEICPYCDIACFRNPEDFLPTLKSSLRGDLRRQIRRLEEQGSLSYHVYTSNELPDSLAALPEFLDLHAQRWPNAYKAPDFHENLLRHSLKEGIVHFSELRLDDKPISWHLGFVDSDRFYYYLPAINPAFAKLSPGKVHLLKCVEEAIRLNLSVYDHLRGEESYKSGWTDETEQLRNFVQLKDSIPSNIKSFVIEKVKPLLSKA